MAYNFMKRTSGKGSGFGECFIVCVSERVHIQMLLAYDTSFRKRIGSELKGSKARQSDAFST